MSPDDPPNETDPSADVATGIETGADANAARATAGRPPRLLGYNDLESAYDYPDRIGRLAGELAARRDDRTLVVGAGDDTALGTLALLGEDGRGAARPFFDAVRPAAETFGNHDFDFGDEWLREWAASVPPTYCCANLAGPWADEVPDWTAVDRAGTTVAVVGVAHPATDDICGVDLDAGFDDPVPAVESAAVECRAAGADHVVVAAHVGRHAERLARETDVDVVLGGHVHERRQARIDGTLLVRTAGGGGAFVEVVLEEAPTATFHEVPAERPTGDEGDTQGPNGTPPFDEALADTYGDLRSAADADDVVATVDDPIHRSREYRTHGESRVGNFVADAFRSVAGADLAVVPTGMIRDGPPLAGEVTVADVVSVSPFGGGLVTLALDGATLRGLLTDLADPTAELEWVGGHLSGARARWDDDGLATVDVGGAPLDPDATYRIATADYLVVVDAYEAVGEDDVVARHGRRYDALLEHARDGGLDVACEGRLSRVSTATTDGE